MTDRKRHISPLMTDVERYQIAVLKIVWANQSLYAIAIIDPTKYASYDTRGDFMNFGGDVLFLLFTCSFEDSWIIIICYSQLRM